MWPMTNRIPMIPVTAITIFLPIVLCQNRERAYMRVVEEETGAATVVIAPASSYQRESTDMGSLTAWADFSSAARSSAVSSISRICSRPFLPSLHGTPR